MNITDHFTNVKNLANAIASIGAPVNDGDLVVMTCLGNIIISFKFQL